MSLHRRKYVSDRQLSKRKLPLEVKESTTKRAKSQIKRSSLRQWITRAAKSVTVALRLNLVDSNCLKETGWGLDRSASRKRFLCAEQVGQSKSACHSVSSTFSPLILQKKAKTLQLNVISQAGKLLPSRFVCVPSREVRHTAQKAWQRLQMFMTDHIEIRENRFSEVLR